MEDLFKKLQQTVIDEISEIRNFFSNEMKIINEKIESLKFENVEAEQGMGTNIEDLLENLKRIIIVFDDTSDIQNIFPEELKEMIATLNDRKVETKEDKLMFTAIEDLLKNLQQIAIDKMSQTRISISRELKMINERIECLKGGTSATNSGMDFFDLYTQESLVGEGSMGRGYKVRELETGKVYAMKSIGLDENGLTPKVAREISALLDIKHANIVKLEKVHSSEGSLYLIMEYVGDNLSTIIRKGGKINGNIAKAWLRELLLATDYLHERDLIHCNLKPENILIDSSLKLKIAGFGSVSRISDDTMFSKMVNTIYLRAPEQLFGFNDYCKPIDISAIGCIFAEMVEGKSLFGPGDKLDTEINILHEIFVG